MGPFSASLKVPGDTSALAATLLVENGRLNISAGDQSIGDWSLEEIQLDPIDTGYRMSADGEQLLIEVKDQTAFQEAVDENSRPKIRTRPKITQRIRSEKRSKKEKAPDVSAARVSSNGQTTTEEQPVEEVASTGVIARVDNLMEKAEERFGALLPAWVFGRVTALVLVILLLLMFVLPSLVSSVFLVTGLVIVVFGAVVYTDGHLAAKLLPGRSTPAHVLIVGVGILLFGVLIGVIAG